MREAARRITRPDAQLRYKLAATKRRLLRQGKLRAKQEAQFYDTTSKPKPKQVVHLAKPSSESLAELGPQVAYGSIESDSESLADGTHSAPASAQARSTGFQHWVPHDSTELGSASHRAPSRSTERATRSKTPKSGPAIGTNRCPTAASIAIGGRHGVLVNSHRLVRTAFSADRL